MRANSITALATSKAGEMGQVAKYQATMVALASVTLFFEADFVLRSAFRSERLRVSIWGRMA